MASLPTRIESDRILLRRRWRRNNHRSGVMWFTGLSGSGKSTLVMALERHLFDEGYQVFALDGDNLRYGLNSDLGFSPQDRRENIRRVGEGAALFAGSGFVVLTAFISPDTADRQRARQAVGEGFHEIFLDPGLDACEQRDPKGLYKKARAGEIPQFTGISAPYEAPTDPDIRLDTAAIHIEDCVGKLAQYADGVFGIHRP